MSYEQKAIVKIDSDGAVAKCAKGLAGSECGYKAGAKVCGKCGAMAVEVKMVPVNEMAEAPEDELSEEEYKQMMRMRRANKEMGMAMDEDMEDEEDSAVSNYLEPMKKGGMLMPMPADEMMDDHGILGDATPWKMGEDSRECRRSMEGGELFPSEDVLNLQKVGAEEIGMVRESLRNRFANRARRQAWCLGMKEPSVREHEMGCEGGGTFSGGSGDEIRSDRWGDRGGG